MKMTQFAKFANNATKQILGTSGLIRENLQSMFTYPDAINILDPVTVSGNVIHINDGAPLNAKRATVYIKPLQSGSGDPSPDNIRPISGWVGINVIQSGKNIYSFDPTNILEGVTVNGDSRRYYPLGLSDCQLSFSAMAIQSGVFTDTFINVGKLSNGKLTLLVNFLTTINILEPTVYFSPDEEAVLMTSSSISAMNNNLRKYNIQIEVGSVVTPYEPYDGETYNITFPAGVGTVYGGTLNLTNGVLTVTHGNIDSYNSEILPGKWISSMDVYSASDTPTIGAQVVYELATPLTYQLTPTNILMFNGINNIYADCGSMELEYYRQEMGGYLNG